MWREKGGGGGGGRVERKIEKRGRREIEIVRQGEYEDSY